MEFNIFKTSNNELVTCKKNSLTLHKVNYLKNPPKQIF